MSTGTGMDEALRTVLKDIDPNAKHAGTRRGSSTMFSRVVEIFLEDGKPEQVVDLEKLAEVEGRSEARAFSAVAQSLRIALNETMGPDGKPLANLARVSVDVDAEKKGQGIITLVRRTPEETAKWIKDEPIRKARAAEARATKAKIKAEKEAAARAE